MASGIAYECQGVFQRVKINLTAQIGSPWLNYAPRLVWKTRHNLSTNQMTTFYDWVALNKSQRNHNGQSKQRKCCKGPMRTHWKQANYLKPGITQVTMSRFILVLYLIGWVSTPSLPSLNAILIFFWRSLRESDDVCFWWDESKSLSSLIQGLLKFFFFCFWLDES